VADELTPTLRAAVIGIPGPDGYWKARAEQEYLAAAKTLVERGFTDEQAASLLEGLYWAAAECYGGN
jgi:hypothetical protein